MEYTKAHRWCMTLSALLCLRRRDCLASKTIPSRCRQRVGNCHRCPGRSRRDNSRPRNRSTPHFLHRLVKCTVQRDLCGNQANRRICILVCWGSKTRSDRYRRVHRQNEDLGESDQLGRLYRKHLEGSRRNQVRIRNRQLLGFGRGSDSGLGNWVLDIDC